MNIYMKWSFIVGFNTIFSLMFASDFMGTVSGALGVVAGIAFFILLYAKLDVFLLKTSRIMWRKAMLFATLAMGVFSLYPVIPMISGSIALDMTASILNISSNGIQHNGFFPIFITSIIAGMVLSILVMVLTVLLRFIFLNKAKLVKTDADND